MDPPEHRESARARPRPGGEGGQRRPHRIPNRMPEIIEISARLFYEKSYRGTTMQDIADAMGILKGSLYHYVKSKDDLLYAIVQEAHEHHFTMLHGVQWLDTDPFSKVKAFLRGHMMQNFEHILSASTFYRDFQHLTEERRRYVIAQRDTYERAFRQLIVEAQREGRICPDLDPRLVSILLLTSMNSLFMWYRSDGPWSPEYLGEAYTDALLAAISCEPRTHRTGHRSLHPAPERVDGRTST